MLVPLSRGNPPRPRTPALVTAARSSTDRRGAAGNRESAPSLARVDPEPGPRLRGVLAPEDLLRLHPGRDENPTERVLQGRGHGRAPDDPRGRRGRLLDDPR